MIKDVNDEEYIRFSSILVKKEESLKKIDIQYMKSEAIEEVKSLISEEIKQQLKEGYQLIIDKKSKEFIEKQKIFLEKEAEFKKLIEDTNFKDLIEEKIKSFEPFILEFEEMLKKGLNYESLLNKILKPLKKRLIKEIKKIRRDKLLIFEKLKALKVLLEKGFEAKIEDF